MGSEVSRALQWRTRNAEIPRRALERALDLIDLTLDDPRLDFLVGTNRYGSNGTTLQRYFDAFAVAASNARTRY